MNENLNKDNDMYFLLFEINFVMMKNIIIFIVRGFC